MTRVVSGRLSNAPLEKNGWDDMDFTARLAYHSDGPIGSALSNMGREARMDVDGQPLANVLGRIATDVVKGRRTPQDGVNAYKAVRDRLPTTSRARAWLDDAVHQIDAPTGPAPAVPNGTPELLRRLVTQLHAIPLVRHDPATELTPLLEICGQAASGQLHGSRLTASLERLANRRHESFGDSGKFAIDDSILSSARTLRGQRRRG